jgi:4a-hydroxytetrahydrobiopterin dehydratase
MTNDDLLNRHCQPLEGHAPMSTDEINARLAQVPGWHLHDGALEKSYSFPDYHHTMAFVNALAWIAHREDHHPDLAVGYSRCTVRFNTHSVGGISINDFICAAKVDALLI